MKVEMRNRHRLSAGRRQRAADLGLDQCRGHEGEIDTSTATQPGVPLMNRANDTDWLTRFCLLAMKLPSNGGQAAAVCCRKCGAWSGSVANSAGIMFGYFASDIQYHRGHITIATKLVDAVLIADKSVSLKCVRCGFVTRWRR